MDKITVLLSSYNGDTYLKEQLDSIFSQENVEPTVIVRNDGSRNPATSTILDEYSQHYPLCHIKGENLGAGKSFFELVKEASGSEYYCFADQDDVWNPEKLAEGIRMLKQEDNSQPLLYFCNYNLSDAQGEIIQQCVSRDLHLTKENSLLESFALGCSMVFNDRLLQMVKSHMPKADIIHDRWFFLTAMFFGKVIYDDRPHFNYRQHGGNVIGAQTVKEKEKNIMRIFMPPTFPIAETARMFLDVYEGELSPADLRIVRRCANYNKSLPDMLYMLFSPSYRFAYGGWKRRLYWNLRLLLRKL